MDSADVYDLDRISQIDIEQSEQKKANDFFDPNYDIVN